MKKYLFLDFDGVINTHRSLFKKLAMHYNIPCSNADWDKRFWNSPDGTNPEIMKQIDDAIKDGISFPDVAGYNFPFDYDCIEVCNKIIENNNAEIIIISSWRTGRDLEELQELADEHGLNGKIIGRTGHQETRAEEIYEWITLYQKKYERKIESICILDDEHGFDIDYMFGDYTVKDITELRNGLRNIHINKSKVIFNKPFDINKIEK